MNPCTVRPCVKADTAFCIAILALAGRDAFGPVVDAAAFQAATLGEQILVAECDGVVMGFAAVYTGAAPEHFLHHLYVHPAHSGKGIGAQLLAAVGAFWPSAELEDADEQYGCAALLCARGLARRCGRLWRGRRWRVDTRALSSRRACALNDAGVTYPALALALARMPGMFDR